MTQQHRRKTVNEFKHFITYSSKRYYTLKIASITQPGAAQHLAGVSDASHLGFSKARMVFLEVIHIDIMNLM